MEENQFHKPEITASHIKPLQRFYWSTIFIRKHLSLPFSSLNNGASKETRLIVFVTLPSPASNPFRYCAWWGGMNNRNNGIHIPSYQPAKRAITSRLYPGHNLRAARQDWLPILTSSRLMNVWGAQCFQVLYGRIGVFCKIQGWLSPKAPCMSLHLWVLCSDTACVSTKGLMLTSAFCSVLVFIFVFLCCGVCVFRVAVNFWYSVVLTEEIPAWQPRSRCFSPFARF